MCELAWMCYKKLLRFNYMCIYTYRCTHRCSLENSASLLALLLCCFSYCITNHEPESESWKSHFLWRKLWSIFSRRIRAYMQLQCKDSFSPSSLLQLMLVWQKLATMEKCWNHVSSINRYQSQELRIKYTTKAWLNCISSKHPSRLCLD